MSLYKAFRGLATGSARDAALLSTGSLVANLIGLIAVPILSRLYSPSDFGLLALFMSVAAIARSVATGRYEMAVPLTRTQGAAFCVLRICLAFGLVFIFLLTVALWFGRDSLENFLDAPGFGPWLLAVPLAVAALSFFQALRYWYIRQRDFLRLAKVQIGQATLRVLVSSTAGLMLSGQAFGLLIGTLISEIGAAVYLLGGVRKLERKTFRARCTTKRLKSIASRFRELPANSLTTSFPNALSTNLLPLTLAFFFGSTAPGLFLMVTQLAIKPTGFAVNAVWNVAYGRLGKMQHASRVRYIATLHLIVCFALAIPLSVITAFSDLADNFLGEQWMAVNALLPAFAVMVFFNSVSNLSSYFTVFEDYRNESLWNLTLVASRIGLVVLTGYAFRDLTLAMTVFALASAGLYFSVNIYWGLKLDCLKSFLLNLATNFVPLFGLSGIFLILVNDPLERLVYFVAAILIHAALFGWIRMKTVRSLK